MANFPLAATPTLGSALDQPQGLLPGMTQTPPKDEKELQERLSGWDSFFKELSTNDNLRMSIMRFGLSALSPRAPGVSSIGHIAQAGLVGLDAFQRGALQEKLMEQKATQQGLENKRADEALELSGRRVTAQEKNVDSLIKERNESDQIGGQKSAQESFVDDYTDILLKTEGSKYKTREEARRAAYSALGLVGGKGMSKQEVYLKLATPVMMNSYLYEPDQFQAVLQNIEKQADKIVNIGKNEVNKEKYPPLVGVREEDLKLGQVYSFPITPEYPSGLVIYTQDAQGNKGIAPYTGP